MTIGSDLEFQLASPTFSKALNVPLEMGLSEGPFTDFPKAMSEGRKLQRQPGNR
jgi:hypothetical protein